MPVGRLLPIDRRPRRDPAVEAAREVWGEAAGEQVARHSHPMRMAGEALLVHCDSSTWASELTLLEEYLRERLTGLLGERAPSRLRFEVGALPAVDPAIPDVVRAPSAGAVARARRVGSHVADESLRHAVERAVRSSFGTTS